MATLTREAILNAKDEEVRTVDVPEWGGELRLRGLSSKDRDRWELECQRAKETGSVDVQVRATLVARSIIDDAGERVFTDADIEALGERSGKIVDRLFDVAVELSGLGPDDVEELAGN